MAYVKISDPKIIDLPTIHQIVNVVNQHSDNISAITNNFGSVYSNVPTTSGGTTQGLYDISSQQIYYGYTTINAANADSVPVSPNFEYLKSVTFNSSFTTAPVVVASISTVGTTTPLVQDLVVDVRAVNQTTFLLALRHTGSNATSQKAGAAIYGANGVFLGNSTSVKINWIAIGHK
jgi:hypothetical protein